MTVTYKNQKFSLASFLSRTFIDCGLHHIFVGLVQGVQGTILHCLSHVFTTFFKKKKKNKQKPLSYTNHGTKLVDLLFMLLRSEKA